MESLEGRGCSRVCRSTHQIQQKEKIANSSFYEIEEEVVTLKREKLNDYYQLCVKCQTTCCQSCRWPEGAIESQCTYFNGEKNCPKCEGKCPKISHIRTNEKVTKVKEKIKEVKVAEIGGTLKMS
jgi:hypothetical protein